MAIRITAVSIIGVGLRSVRNGNRTILLRVPLAFHFCSLLPQLVV